MPDSYFLRTAGPVTLNVKGKRMSIKHKDIVYGDHNYFISFPGFQHLPGYSPNVSAVPAPVANKSKDVFTPPTPNFEEIDSYQPPVGKESLESTVINVGDSAKEQSPSEKQIDLSPLDPLRELSNREWFALTLDELQTYLNQTGIDYSHLTNDRFVYAKFIKTILKENPK